MYLKSTERKYARIIVLKVGNIRYLEEMNEPQKQTSLISIII